MKKNLESLFNDASGMDKRSAQYIINALEKNNLDGFDYLEFKQSLSGMAHLKMDETLKFQSAFATASAIGLTRVKLLETANFYKKIVEREKQQFDSAMEAKIKSEVAEKQNEVQKLEQSINKMYDEIRVLKEKIATYQTKIEKNQESINGIQGKIDLAKSSFEKAHGIILKHIDEDIKKIEEFIK